MKTPIESSKSLRKKKGSKKIYKRNLKSLRPPHEDLKFIDIETQFVHCIIKIDNLNIDQQLIEAFSSKYPSIPFSTARGEPSTPYCNPNIFPIKQRKKNYLENSLNFYSNEKHMNV